MKFRNVYFILLFGVLFNDGYSQQSVARIWNEVLLNAIRNDYARPTIHARNLFHTSIAMYDGWAVYDKKASTYLLGNIVHDFSLPFHETIPNISIDSAQKTTISYACYRLLLHRFKNSAKPTSITERINFVFDSLGYDKNFLSTDYSNGSPAALGNYLAEGIIDYGYQDGANEQNEYLNSFYSPSNPSLILANAGNPRIINPNRWQPLAFDVFIDQNGNITKETTPTFLSPEWGRVQPFSLKEENKTIYNRDGNEYHVYHDPGPPPYLSESGDDAISNEYKWNFELVAMWSSHLHPKDSVLWDISPRNSGNIAAFPTSFAEFKDFYDLKNGGDPGRGYSINPVTALPYDSNMVYRGDYTRVLAEFWADGPNSETPPGHWFTILNYVNDHPLHKNKFMGTGELLNDLEWDVKAYFLLGGAMHDAAIASWGIKGWYDYIRPISAIRYLADQGQCSDPDLPHYSPKGIHLIPGFIELVGVDDPLIGNNLKNLNKIKIYAWRGPKYVNEPLSDVAGVGWILAENWWPYQRPSFVTPPFAGYISGHSTYSRTAAEILTYLTGDAFFPGGMGVFNATKNEFLVFEEGPSESIDLQWATYRDASDQCSLSRIWGGIHPPADDIPGRKIGKKIGAEAFQLANTLFEGTINTTKGNLKHNYFHVYPTISSTDFSLNTLNETTLSVYAISGMIVEKMTSKNEVFKFGREYRNGIYFVKIENEYGTEVRRIIKK